MVTCEKCDGKCCKYVCVEIDEPEDAEDWDNLRWYAAHEGIFVYKDHEGDWYVEMTASCEHLGKDNRCMIYPKRPQVCRNHATDECESSSDDSPYALVFRSLAEVDEYIEKNNIKGTRKGDIKDGKKTLPLVG